jgi:hypothetical protein
LPHPAVADFPIRGYEFYDYHHELDNNTFVNYQDNATRKTGAISYLLFTSFGMSSNNTVQRSKFINAKPVYFPPIDNRWSNDDYGNTVYKTSVFKDKDGTITGVANSYIVNSHRNRRRRSLRGQAHLERCGVQGRYRRMNVGAVVVLSGRRLRAAALWCGGAPRAGGPGAAGRGAGAPGAGAARPCLCHCPRWWSNQRYTRTFRDRQSFSAAMARSSLPTGKPTYERAPSTR